MILKNGSKGDEVKKLQKKLGVEAIGTFGPKTEAAVKAWQKANGLKDDGIVGPCNLG
jgi:peptidoglycan hydrolase-like protein with peptidoglycan-binding domain